MSNIGSYKLMMCLGECNRIINASTPDGLCWVCSTTCKYCKTPFDWTENGVFVDEASEGNNQPRKCSLCSCRTPFCKRQRLPHHSTRCAECTPMCQTTGCPNWTCDHSERFCKECYIKFEKPLDKN